MGLEIVEIIMVLEDEFGVSIKDEDIADVQTVGQLYNVIMGKVGDLPRDDVCMTSRVFYRVRRGLQEATGMARGDITPATPLAEVLPSRVRRRRWGTWSARSAVAFPQLRLPGPLAVAVGVVTVLICLGLAWGLYKAELPWYVAWPLALLWWLPVALIVAAVEKLASPLAVLFPRNVHTVGDLAHAVVRSGVPRHPTAAKDCSLVTPEVVWNRVAHVIAREANIKRELITPEATFRDLEF